MHPVIPDLSDDDMNRALRIIAQRRAGMSYSAIAALEGVPKDEIVSRLCRVSSAMRVDVRNCAPEPNHHARER